MPLLRRLLLRRPDAAVDGAADVVGAGGGQYATFLLNTAGEDHPSRHRLAVSLCGTHSNTEAIGSRLVLHANGRSQQRTLRAGEDLFAQHSATQFFGLGAMETADSLEVFWPMGGRSCLYDVPADNAVSIIEGAEEMAVEFTAAGDSVWLHLIVPPQWTSVVWNGDTLNTLSVLVAEGEPTFYEAGWCGGLWQGGVQGVAGGGSHLDPRIESQHARELACVVSHLAVLGEHGDLGQAVPPLVAAVPVRAKLGCRARRCSDMPDWARHYDCEADARRRFFTRRRWTSSD